VPRNAIGDRRRTGSHGGSSLNASTQLTDDTPAEHRLTFDLDEQAHTDLEEEIFGKRALMTDRDQWPIADIDHAGQETGASVGNWG
jgi:hypothetical protein